LRGEAAPRLVDETMRILPDVSELVGESVLQRDQQQHDEATLRTTPE